MHRIIKEKRSKHAKWITLFMMRITQYTCSIDLQFSVYLYIIIHVNKYIILYEYTVYEFI